MRIKNIVTRLHQKIMLILFGLLVTLLVLELGLRISGFILLALQDQRNREAIKQKGVYRIMCVGESTTQGQFPYFLGEVLNQGPSGVRFSVIDKGRAGIDTSVILKEIVYNLDQYNPDMVVAMMGVNDDDGELMPYKIESSSNVLNFFRSFRIYKLISILKLNNKSSAVQNYNIDREQYLKKAIELSPKNDLAYAELGKLYAEREFLDEAKQYLKKAIELNPENDLAYAELGGLYIDQGSYDEAKQYLKKAIKLNPENDLAYTELGGLYINQVPCDEAEQYLKKAIELNPKSSSHYFELGQFYFSQNRLSEASETLRLAPQLNDKQFGFLANICGIMKKYELAEEYFRRSKEASSRLYNPLTRHNYLMLKDILHQRSIKLVCVQYPMCSIESLKKIFQGSSERIIFVDNERIFKEGVRKEGYREYFTDLFGGTFGHCTNKGNKLLAENIAKAILKDKFGN